MAMGLRNVCIWGSGPNKERRSPAARRHGLEQGLSHVSLPNPIRPPLQGPHAARSPPGPGRAIGQPPLDCQQNPICSHARLGRLPEGAATAQPPPQPAVRDQVRRSYVGTRALIEPTSCPWCCPPLPPPPNHQPHVPPGAGPPQHGARRLGALLQGPLPHHGQREPAAAGPHPPSRHRRPPAAALTLMLSPTS